MDRIAKLYFNPFYDGWVTVFNMYQEYFYIQEEVANFGACHQEYGFCFFMYAFEANSQIYYYGQYFRATTAEDTAISAYVPNVYDYRSNYTNLRSGFEYSGAGWMQPGGTYFYNFRPVASVAEQTGFMRQENGATATVWTWASVGRASINLE